MNFLDKLIGHAITVHTNERAFDLQTRQIAANAQAARSQAGVSDAVKTAVVIGAVVVVGALVYKRLS